MASRVELNLFGSVLPQSRLHVLEALPLTTRRNPVVLLAEDEEYVRHLIRLILQDDHEILAAANGAEALDLSRSRTEPIDLLLTDIDMPGMNGYELHRRLSRERPDIKVLFISGASLQIPDSETLHPYLAKPFDASTLRTRVRELLPRRAHAQQKAILMAESDACGTTA